ncbi:hypothetical protein [Lacrimispora aerotolerans]|uniref:hypothetical protein n=1 Tax=Lacrimispora aerotolerans TaxID=36832 RepID=UPI00047B6698|nr:hypothetical protein [Lacrimispora aerotolerans]
MKNKSIPSIEIHNSDTMDIEALSDKINEFYIDFIERRLRDSDLSTDEKIAVIDIIKKQLKLRDSNGITK